MYKIGICGAPGAGKSTTSAGVFYECKRNGIGAELVQEFIREELNKGFRLHSVADQLRIFMKQREREDIIPNNIDVMITDSPVYLSLYYAMDFSRSIGKTEDDNMLFLIEQIFKERNRYDVVIMLRRTKKYVEDGTRFQTEAESDKIYTELKILFDLLGIKYIDMDGDSNAVKKIIDIITERYKNNGAV